MENPTPCAVQIFKELAVENIKLQIKLFLRRLQLVLKHLCVFLNLFLDYRVTLVQAVCRSRLSEDKDVIELDLNFVAHPFEKLGRLIYDLLSIQLL